MQKPLNYVSPYIQKAISYTESVTPKIKEYGKKADSFNLINTENKSLLRYLTTSPGHKYFNGLLCFENVKKPKDSPHVNPIVQLLSKVTLETLKKMVEIDSRLRIVKSNSNKERLFIPNFFTQTEIGYILNIIKTETQVDMDNKSKPVALDTLQQLNIEGISTINRKKDKDYDKIMDSTEGSKLKLHDYTNSHMTKTDAVVNKMIGLGSLKPERIKQTIDVVKREKMIVRQLKSLYQNECQICKEAVDLGIRTMSHVHHIRPLGKHMGPDVASNMIVLCPNHHNMFDNGALTIDLQTLQVKHQNPNHTLNGKTINLKHEISKEFIEYHDMYIFGKKSIQKPEKKKLRLRRQYTSNHSIYSNKATHNILEKERNIIIDFCYSCEQPIRNGWKCGCS